MACVDLSQGYTYSVFNLVYETNTPSCRIWDALGFKRIGRVKGCGNLKSYPGELVDAIIYGRDLGTDDDFVSEERFDKIRFYLKNGKYPNGADRAEKSRLRSAATHYKLTGEGEDEKLWLKGKEVIADPQRQYEIARDIHHKSHGGINKTTAAIAEGFHWVRIKETVSQVIRNCPECSEMNKGLSAMRQNQNSNQNNSQNQRYNDNQQSPPATSTPPAYPPPPDSAEDQLHLENQNAQRFQDSEFNMPVDPALMEDIKHLADLPPSPFLAPGQGDDVGLNRNGVPKLEERAPTAREEMRRRLERVAEFGEVRR